VKVVETEPYKRLLLRSEHVEEPFVTSNGNVSLNSD